MTAKEKNLQKKYDSLQLESEKYDFILSLLSEDNIMSTIDKIGKDCYRIGSGVKFNSKVFNKLKPLLKENKEYDEGKWYTYWDLKTEKVSCNLKNKKAEK